MGIRNVVIIDFDRFGRSAGTGRSTRGARGPRLPKVAVVAGPARRDRRRFQYCPQYSIVEGGYRAALDCDLLLCCVDRPLGHQRA
jgi:hypothetical protein